MKWLQPFSGISAKFSAARLTKKRTQEQAASSSVGDGTETADLVPPASDTDEEYNSRPKRRSVDVQRWSMDLQSRLSLDRRTSLDRWHEARRNRNSLDGEATITTDRLTVRKAGTTTIVNRTYLTIKHLGSGTFGRVMLCFNVYDQRLYAIKVCRKSQFMHHLHYMGRQGYANRLRRNLSSNTSAPAGCVLPGQAPAAAGGAGGSSCHAPPGFVRSDQQQQQQQQGLCGSLGQPGPASASIMAFSGSAAAALQSQPQPQLPVVTGFPRQPPPGSGSTEALGAGLPGQAVAGGGGSMVRAPSLEAFGVRPIPSSRRFSLQGLPGHTATWFEGAAAAAGPGGGAPSGFPNGSSGPAGGGSQQGGGLDSAGGSMGTGMGSGSVFAEALTRFQTEELVKEIAILKKLSHPNIVNLVEVIDDPSTDSLLMVMEYVEGGTLESRQVGKNAWETVPEQQVWRNVREVLQGLDYLHFNKVVHGDMKPSNLLCDGNSGKVKIADFGSSVMMGGDKVFSMRNTPGFSTPAFRSPESLTSGYQPSFEMDMWALGVCIFMWVYGRLPFTGAAPFVVYERIRSQEVHFPESEEVSPELQEFMRRLLDKDVLQRLDVVAAMQHPWVTLGGTAPLCSQRESQFAASVGLGGPEPGGAGGVCSSLGGWHATPGVALVQEDLNGAIRQLDGGVGHLMEVVFTEHTFGEGQTIIAAGELANTIHLITSGQVELVAGGTSCDPHPPLISGCEVDMADSQDHDMFDAPAPELSSSPTGFTSAMLSQEVLHGICSSTHICSSSSSKRSSNESCSERIIAVKGPGDSLGLPPRQEAPGGQQSGGGGGGSLAAAALPHGELRWQVSARARGCVTVFRARLLDLVQLASAHPEIEPAVRQLVVQQETDMMVAEALRQLRLCHHGPPSHPPPQALPQGLPTLMALP